MQYFMSKYQQVFLFPFPCILKLAQFLNNAFPPPILPLMDPCTPGWTEPENKTFREVLIGVDLRASNWFEHLTKMFPNKTPGQLSVRYIDLVGDIGRKLRDSPLLIYTDPLAVKIAAEMEDLSSTDLLPHPRGFQGTPSARSDGRVANKEVLVPEIEKELEILSEKITKGGINLPLETEGMEMVPGVVTEINNENKIPTAVTVAAAGKRMVGRVGTYSTRKDKLWSEEEHRLFLMGLEVHGRGAWKKIAKDIVHTRTPTQVASHAQKYFGRQSGERRRRRDSILDITTIAGTTKTSRASMYD